MNRKKAMKKITSLFILICAASQLYGMEPEQKMGAFGELPDELHKEIVNALVESKDLGQVIAAVKVASVLQGVQYNTLEDFTALINILAKKFPDISRKEIAEKFQKNLKYSEIPELLRREAYQYGSTDNMTLLLTSNLKDSIFNNIGLWGWVADGHGGSETAEYIQKHFPNIFKHNLQL